MSVDSSRVAADGGQQDVVIRVNGEPCAVAAGTTITGLLAELGLPCDRVAVEMDRQIVRRDCWHQTELPPGGSLEIVHFVGGG